MGLDWNLEGFRLDPKIGLDWNLKGLTLMLMLKDWNSKKSFFFERLVEENMNKEGGEWTREEEEGNREEEERRGRREINFIFLFLFYFLGNSIKIIVCCEFIVYLCASKSSPWSSTLDDMWTNG